MNEFLKFFDEKTRLYPMHLEIVYNKICGWSIYIYKKGCADDGTYLEIAYAVSHDMEYAFAKAHVMLKDFLLENNGGY